MRKEVSNKIYLWLGRTSRPEGNPKIWNMCQIYNSLCAAQRGSRNESFILALETFYYSSLWNINGVGTQMCFNDTIICAKHYNSESFSVWIYWCSYIYYSSYCRHLFLITVRRSKHKFSLIWGSTYCPVQHIKLTDSLVFRIMERGAGEHWTPSVHSNILQSFKNQWATLDH